MRHHPTRLVRTLLTLAGLGLAASCGGDEPSVDPTDGGGGGGGCANNATADVPEAYRCLWEGNYEGCTTSQGRQGRQLYWVIDGQVDADGKITGSERVWWFFPEEWNTDDCVDTLSLDGQEIVTDLERLGCATCEEAYSTVREVQTNNCNLGYNLLFDEDEEGLKQTLLFDTLTPNGEPNEDNKILVLHRTTDENGSTSTKEYARGNMTPEGAEHAAPYSFTWVGSACRGR